MASKISLESVKATVKSFVERHPTINQYLETAAEKTKIDKAFIAIVAAIIPVILIISIGFGKFVIDMVGFVYPLYASIKAIQSPDTKDDQQWLTYWLIFGIFKIVESVAESLISFIPFYFLFKVLFLVWCYYPTTQGASKVYDGLIKPYVVPHIMDHGKNE